MNVVNPFLEAPRWPGGPMICSYENLPAFNDKAAMDEFRRRNGLDSLLGQSSSIAEKWLCEKCGCIHYIGIPVAPSGTTSGTGRDYTPPLPRYRREMLPQEVAA